MTTSTGTASTGTAFPALRDALQTALLAAYDEHVARTAWGGARVRAHQRERLGALLARAARARRSTRGASRGSTSPRSHRTTYRPCP